VHDQDQDVCGVEVVSATPIQQNVATPLSKFSLAL